jgi:hypothetical protein
MLVCPVFCSLLIEQVMGQKFNAIEYIEENWVRLVNTLKKIGFVW